MASYPRWQVTSEALRQLVLYLEATSRPRRLAMKVKTGIG